MTVNQRQLWEMYTKPGKAFLKLRNYEEAQRMFEAALQVAEEMGPKDPHLGVSLNNLAHVHQACRRYAQAETLYTRALNIAILEHGREHPDTAVSMANLAGLYQAREQYDRAEPLYGDALQIFTETLGKEHPSLVTLLENYASLLRKMNRTGEAERLEQQVRDIRAKMQPTEEKPT